MTKYNQRHISDDIYTNGRGAPFEKDDARCLQRLVSDTPSEELGYIKTVEELFSALGNPGRFSIVVFVVISLNMLTVASNHAAGVFMDYIPPHTCDAFGRNLSGHGNDSSVGIEPMNIINSQCHSTHRSLEAGNVSRNCHRGQWKYQVSERESSSVTEWDLVCDRAALAHLSSTLYYVGVMFGGLVFGYVSDTVGRRWAMTISLYLSVGLGIGIAFTTHLVVYIILRTLMGIAIQGFLTTTYIRLLELFGPKFRGFCGNALYCVWGISLNYLGLMSWLLKDWRNIQIASIGQGIIGVFYIWILPESLRWLLANGKINKAARLTERIYRINRCEDRRCLEKTLMSRLAVVKSAGKLSIIDFFRNATLRYRTIIIAYVTLAVNVGYWGLTYNTQALVGNHYQNFVLSAFPEIFIYLANIFIVNRFGRKRPMMFYFSITAVCCLISCFLTTVFHKNNDIMSTGVTVVSTIGRLAACGLMGTNDVFMAELYPTTVRNTGVGVCIFVGRFGAVITPVVFSLTEVTFQGLPLLCFGVVTLVAVFVTMLLPDTWMQDLPETLHDLEMTVTLVSKEDALLSSDFERPDGKTNLQEKI